jgi:cytochrome c oxidase subunit IV
MAIREERSTGSATTPPEVRTNGATMASRLERWAPLAGIIFVVLMVTGTFFVAYPIPDADAPRQQIADCLADGGSHMRNIIGAYMWVLGALAFLWFVTRLRSVLRGAQDGILPNVVFGAGVIYSVFMIAAGVTFAAVAYAIGLRDAPVSNPD